MASLNVLQVGDTRSKEGAVRAGTSLPTACRPAGGDRARRA